MYVAAERLERHGIPLAADEVHFSLFHRDPQLNGAWTGIGMPVHYAD